MPIKRTCEVCGTDIPPSSHYLFVEYQLRRDEPTGAKMVVKVCSDYCEACVRLGAAQKDLLDAIDQWSATEDGKRMMKVTSGPSSDMA